MRTSALAVATFVAWSVLALSSASVLAQQQSPAATSRATAQTPPSSGVNVDRLPLDLQRIERQLRRNRDREEFDGVRLRYFVDVFGQSPRIELFAPEENLSTGPVPWGAPTHNDMLQQVTPKEFRSPPMDLSAVMRWLSEKVGK